jgi:hypothetical protein
MISQMCKDFYLYTRYLLYVSHSYRSMRESYTSFQIQKKRKIISFEYVSVTFQKLTTERLEFFSDDNSIVH